MNAFPAQKTVRALLVTLVLVVAWHVLMQDESMPLEKVLPGILILVLGELVRERVVAGTPATDDEELRAERRARAKLLYFGGFLVMALGAAFIVLLHAPKRTVGFGLLAIAMSMSAAGVGLTLNDTAAVAKAAPPQDQARSAQLSALIVLVPTLLAMAIIGMSALTDWEMNHRIPTRTSVQLGVLVVGAIGLVIYSMRAKVRAGSEADE